MAKPGTRSKEKTPPHVAVPKTFSIPYPMVWLSMLVIIVYYQSFNAGLTELDDIIFIRDFHTYNEDWGNMITSFGRGVFNATNDTYYRPLFLDLMIFNFHLSGPFVSGYHAVNIVLHIIAVILLYKLLLKLEVSKLNSFILSALFAVHPVLSQAVSWIPGRNDTLLAVFSFSFFISAINADKENKPLWFLLSFLLLLCALFTKETAVFNLPIAFTLLWMLSKENKIFEKSKLVQYGLWIGAFFIWFWVRSMATLKETSLQPGNMISDALKRLPLVLQYLGKIFMPFNLSVFPTIEDTVIYYGIAATVLLVGILYLNKQRVNKRIIAGLATFILYLLPVLLIPNSLNEQSFEHRLYLPFLGILICLDQTILLQNKWSDSKRFWSAAATLAVLAFANMHHQQYFNNPHAFWSQAVETSPHSAYANMMLGARTDDTKLAENYFRKAYSYNPNEKYLNFYFGVMLQKKDSVLASEPFLLKEKNKSGYYECDFYLARVAFQKNDLTAAATYLETYLTKDPSNTQANNNLLLLYYQTQQKDKARAQAKSMQEHGLVVPPQILNDL